MPAMACVFAPRAVGQNQAVARATQEPDDGLPNLPDRQRRLVRSIIEIRHLTLRPESLEDLAELWRAVRIHCSA
jgi:hypothetical protein